jgi:hypothetical protein
LISSIGRTKEKFLLEKHCLIIVTDFSGKPLLAAGIAMCLAVSENRLALNAIEEQDNSR